MTISSRTIQRVFKEESGLILAGKIRLLGDFDLAEDALQEAFATALERWPEQGVPDNPAAWLTTTARHKAIDQLRRGKARGAMDPRIEVEAMEMVESFSDSSLPDDRLRLMFTCCHPALDQEAQVALMLLHD